MRHAHHPSERLDRRGMRVLVLGMGVHGGGVGGTRFLVEQGADVTVTDLRTVDQRQSSVAYLQSLPVRSVLGAHGGADVRAPDVVLRNPGVLQASPLLAASARVVRYRPAAPAAARRDGGAPGHGVVAAACGACRTGTGTGRALGCGVAPGGITSSRV
jgi:UDP-N-acetylmuramoylalanine--D-glutamate ligase